MLAERESVLPRYVKFSTAWSLCPFTVMLGSWYGFPWAGWYITSVFLVLMVKPKLSQTVENPSISSCISCSLLSVISKDEISDYSIFDFADCLKTPGLNSFPSHLYLMGMLGEVSPKASINITENNRLNSVGEGRSLALLNWSLETGPRRFHHKALRSSSRRETV